MWMLVHLLNILIYKLFQYCHYVQLQTHTMHYQQMPAEIQIVHFQLGMG